MKEFVCKNCGSDDLYRENGFYVCRYCGSKFLITRDDEAPRETVIELDCDVKKLLQRAKEDPTRAGKCAERILEIDPNNIEAKKIIEKTSNRSNGCYVATAVYGSYDCPQVWTLRRFRDYILAETWYGRASIRAYYSISPTLVKWFGHTNWFKKLWKWKLDPFVERLQSKGIDSTPYKDKNW